MRTTFAALIPALALVACGPADLPQAEAKTKAQALVGAAGTVGSVERVRDAKIDAWKAVAAMSGGGQLELFLSPTTGDVLVLESEKGPFDYDLTVAGYISFARARSLAFEQQVGAIEFWELNVDEKLYEFYVRASDQKLWEIKLSPTDGKLLSKEEKAMRD
ncbi:MAG: PepSY domain-containing protein [Archangiaceae bacterium]|nr:PepSY domain-containing protein [Archangiaceae bacterium]